MNGPTRGWKSWKRRWASLQVVALAACTSQQEPCQQQPGGTMPDVKVGILYSLWHCPMREPDGRVFDNTEILADAGHPWGPVLHWHWWGRPDLGYYCLSQNDDALVLHALMLRDARVDFVIVDASNAPCVQNRAYQELLARDACATGVDPACCSGVESCGGAQIWGSLNAPMEGIALPFARMVDVWSDVPNAPKIVPWVPMQNHPDSDMAQWMEWTLRVGAESSGADMRFYLDGRPLLLAVNSDGLSRSDPEAIEAFSQDYAVRKMWGLLGKNSADPSEWSFLETCDGDFKASGGTANCDQRISRRDGQSEQVSVSAAYQLGWMSDTSSAVPKFEGNTFRSQMATARNHPDAKVVTITQWNEWGAVRFPCGADQGCENDLQPDGAPAFVDQYNAEYSRDHEPGGGLGDYYYQLLVDEIAALKGAAPPRAAGTIVGNFDGIEDNLLVGWVCGWAYNEPLEVHLYLDGPYGTGDPIAAYRADRPSEPEVAAACGAAGATYRFAIPLDLAFRQAHQGRSIYLHGIAPEGSGQVNDLIPGSGRWRVPPS